MVAPKQIEQIISIWTHFNAQVEVFSSICLRDTRSLSCTWARFLKLCQLFKRSPSLDHLLNLSQRYKLSNCSKGFCHFSENNINFGRLLLLNELSYISRLGLILKTCVCSLKWAQAEVCSSIRWGDMSCWSNPLIMEENRYLPLFPLSLILLRIVQIG